MGTYIYSTQGLFLNLCSGITSVSIGRLTILRIKVRSVVYKASAIIFLQYHWPSNRNLNYWKVLFSDTDWKKKSFCRWETSAWLCTERQRELFSQLNLYIMWGWVLKSWRSHSKAIFRHILKRILAKAMKRGSAPHQSVGAASTTWIAAERASALPAASREVSVLPQWVIPTQKPNASPGTGKCHDISFVLLILIATRSHVGDTFQSVYFTFCFFFPFHFLEFFFLT